MNRVLISLLVPVAVATGLASGADLAERRAYLDWMLHELPAVPSWTAWQEKSGELPPDFDALPQQAFLPDPLRFIDGRPVQGPDDWPERRAEILEQFERYIIGRLPPKPPVDHVELLSETPGNGYTTRMVRLDFGPASQTHLRVQLIIPDGPGPFPALIDASMIGPATLLIRRGYAFVGLPASDFGDDDTADWSEQYPDYDFAAMARRAWAVRMALDYLETEPRIDMQRVAISGYSRNGKMATLAAALDTRIAAAIGGSHGVGGVLPWRMGGQIGMIEGVESTTRMFPDWYHPRLRFFSGREDRLPVDGNLLLAAIAPRPFLIQHGFNDEVTSVWGDEQSYASAAKVYEMLGHRDRLNLMVVPGFHGSNDWEKCFDWLDMQFGRSDRTWIDDPVYTWDFERWSEQHADEVDVAQYPRRVPGGLLQRAGNGAIRTVAEWEEKADAIRQAVGEIVGSAPPILDVPRRVRRRSSTPSSGPTSGGSSRPGQTIPDIPAWAIARNSESFGWPGELNDQTDSHRLYFGFGVRGDLFFPQGTPEDAKLPTVIWLHGYSHPLGYMWVYRRDVHPILALVQAGYAVLAYDQTGFGSRQSEDSPFYDRYPDWSRLGRMIEDASAAVDALESQPLVDPARIYAFGYMLGGMVGLHAAALDPRIQGVVTINGFTPMRTDTPDRGTGGLARFSHERGLVPRLGFFIGHESRVPYDYDELIACIAPRPVLVVQPEFGRGASPAGVQATVETAGQIYALLDARSELELHRPRDITRLSTKTQDETIRWMREHMK